MDLITPSGTADRAEIQRLGSLYDLLSAFAHAKTLPALYDAALAGLRSATKLERVALVLFTSDAQPRIEASHALPFECLTALKAYSPWALGERGAESTVVGAAEFDSKLPRCAQDFAKANIRSLTFVPLESDEGVFGSLVLAYPADASQSEDEVAVARLIAGHLVLALRRTCAEMALIQSERRLQSILDYTPALVFLKDLQGRYKLVNRRFEELVQLNKREILGRTDASIFAPQTAESEMAMDREVLKTGTAVTVEEQVRYPDGTEHTHLKTKFPVEDAEGQIAGIAGIATDITDRKKLESANIHVASIVENSDDAIVSKDLNGIVTSWNPGAERIFGYSAQEMVGKPIATIAAPDVLSEMPGILDKIRNGNRVEHYETRRRRKDGRVIDVSLTVSPVRDASGRIIGASKIARDISERKRTERELSLLLAREKLARKTAELLNRVGPLLATELSVSKLVQSVTDVATELVDAEFGAFFHNVIDESGRSYMLFTLSGVSRDRFEKFPMPRITEVFGPTFRGEGIIRSPNITEDPRYGKNPPYFGMPEGHLPVRSYLAAPVVSRSGEVLGGLFFGHSTPNTFTEQHESLIAGIAAQAAIAMDNAILFEKTEKAQRELSRSNEDLRRANQDLETFAYSASHDLQEPLRTVILTTQFLERRYRDKLPVETAPLLETIVNAAQRTESLIRDVLDYATATKQEQLAPQLVDSSKVLDLALHDLAVLTADSGARVTRDFLPLVTTHADRLRQVFLNIIGNALKYRRPETPVVHVSATRSGDYWQFSITDNGIGIDSKYGEQIFGLFKRLHAQDEYAGSGIGLALCQRIIEQYGGRIWLQKSVLGQGSTFCFTLPAA